VNSALDAKPSEYLAFELTYSNIEVIYLDDVSTDYSIEIFSQFSHDKRIKAIINTVNSGSPFKQWNKGIQAVQGEYI
jgi:glycosyltransferase involved in cell wall biosynthesis